LADEPTPLLNFDFERPPVFDETPVAVNPSRSKQYGQPAPAIPDGISRPHSRQCEFDSGDIRKDQSGGADSRTPPRSSAVAFGT
jgi:hypothetical protein